MEIEQLAESVAERKGSRGSFLRNLGKTAAVGLGIALVPAVNAWSAPRVVAHCCREDCVSPPCGSGMYAWRCFDCQGPVCCYCAPTPGNLGDCRYNLGCGVC